MSDSVSLVEFFRMVYIPLRLQGKSDNTLRLYDYSIRIFGETVGRTPTLADLTDLQIAAHLERLRKKGLSPYSIGKERSQLLAIANLAGRRGMLQIRPEVQAPILPERVPKAWTTNELQRLMGAIASVEGRISGVEAKLWWKALHLVAWDTGERISAIMALKWVWLDDCWLSVPAEVRKGRRADITFKLGTDTLESLEAIRAPKRQTIFEWDRSATYIYQKYTKILQLAGLPFDCKSKFHRMRKSVASHFFAAGGDAQRQLGHADPRTTSKYLDPRIVKRDEPCDVLPRISISNRENKTDDNNDNNSR